VYIIVQLYVKIVASKVFRAKKLGVSNLRKKPYYHIWKYGFFTEKF
jgi:hypothetical protein